MAARVDPCPLYCSTAGQLRDSIWEKRSRRAEVLESPPDHKLCPGAALTAAKTVIPEGESHPGYLTAARG